MSLALPESPLDPILIAQIVARIDALTPFKNDHNFAARYIDPAAALIGRILVRQATVHEDTKLATDLALRNPALQTFGLRVRRAAAILGKDKVTQTPYSEQIVLRLDRFDSGATTEYGKILQGRMDALLYAFADDDFTNDLGHWVFCDMHVFRREQDRFIHRVRQAHRVYNKSDNTLGGAFTISWFSPEFVIARGVGPKILSLRP